MSQRIKVLYVAAEISPYGSTGGLGEVGESLPKALMKEDGIEVRRVMPLYSCVKAELKYLTDFWVPVGQSYETCVVKKDTSEKEPTTYFIDNARYFCRDNIYSYEDDSIRFFFFCQAIVKLLSTIEYKPDLIHMNDWHTGFLPLLLMKEFPRLSTVFTIHNFSYDGFLPPALINGIVTNKEMEKLGYPGWPSFMKAGIHFADRVTTVSKSYAKEIKRGSVNGTKGSQIIKRTISGITNGIDNNIYNPMMDGVQKYPYDINNLEDKRKNRAAICKEYGLPSTELPLLAMVTRLESIKGIDLLFQAISYLELSKFQLIIMGSGRPYYHGMLSYLMEGYKESIAVDFNYSSNQARKIYAAADIYLMPSLSEPCGLSQLYSMRYGAVPIVNPVGGLKDTVKDVYGKPERSTGFYMEEPTGEALAKVIERAVSAYYSKDFIKLIKNCMNYDSSWDKSAAIYHKLYKELLESQ